MPSLIKGYNYDIFISYRQKDNKYDGWVTTFVENLQKELEATFKKEVSVYFDVNPHDGLLETHDVDESLKDKLKCLILIPIISRTYCDPEAFAWEHEFKTFIEQASKDEFGLKVKLPNGNVASRVLPIIIYDLDKQDIKLCESALGGVLRGVEFIYKEPGVNRPLRSNEEKPHENLNNTLYRNQVNKVANTIKDVLNSMRGKGSSTGEAITETGSEDKGIGTEKPVKEKPRKAPKVSLLYRLKNLITIRPKAWRIIALLLLVVSIGATWLYINKPYYSDKPVLRYDIPLTNSLFRTQGNVLDLSPDGESLVYVTSVGLRFIQLNKDEPSQLISGTDNPFSPFFSPDGSWIGFINNMERKIMKVPLTGGNPIAICDLKVDINHANWYENEIIYADGSTIYRVPDTGGTPELLYPLSHSEEDPILWNPQLLPDKKTLLFSQQQEDGGWSILTWKLGSKKNPDVVVERGRDGRYLKSGHIAYTLNNSLYICKFNLKTNHVISEPQIIITNPIFELIARNFGSSQFDISDNGILVYYEQQEILEENLVWVDETGAVSTPISTDARIHPTFGFAAISFDAKYVATSVLAENGSFQGEIIDINTGNSDLFGEDAICPAWSADNSSVYYVSVVTGNQVFQKPLDRSTSPKLLFEIDSVNEILIHNLSLDGRYLPFFTYKEETGYDIGYFDIAENKSEMLEHYNSPEDDAQPAISPDGKWIAYESNYSGQSAIYVAPFPGPGRSTRVSSGRTANDFYSPEWSPDMTALYYLTISSGRELWRINIQASENDFSFEPAQSIFKGGSIGNFDFEIHPNGGRFLVLQNSNYITQEVTEPRIKVISNWEQELEGD